MDNKKYKDSLKVLGYINSSSCNNFNDLMTFLKDNELTLIDNWRMFFYGKKYSGNDFFTFLESEKYFNVDDKKILNYIINGCSYLEDLVNFSINNGFLFKESWMYFWLGSVDGLDVNNSPEDGNNFYYFLEEGFKEESKYWKMFLENEDLEKRHIRELMISELYYENHKEEIENERKIIAIQLKEQNKEILELIKWKKRLLKSPYSYNISFDDIKVQRAEIEKELMELQDRIKEPEEHPIYKARSLNEEEEIKNYEIPEEIIISKLYEQGLSFVIDRNINGGYTPLGPYDIISYGTPWDDIEDSEYCASCMESPCQCSDKERTGYNRTM